MYCKTIAILAVLACASYGQTTATLSGTALDSITTGLDTYNDGMANARPPGVPRNSLEGPGYAGLDLRWSRDFYLVKTKKEKGPMATLGMDAFDVLNHVNYPSYVGVLTSPFFGRPVSAQPGRRLQASVHFRF